MIPFKGNSEHTTLTGSITGTLADFVFDRKHTSFVSLLGLNSVFNLKEKKRLSILQTYLIGKIQFS